MKEVFFVIPCTAKTSSSMVNRRVAAKFVPEFEGNIFNVLALNIMFFNKFLAVGYGHSFLLLESFSK